MELENIKESLIGIVSNNYKKEDYDNLFVRDVVIKKPESALKMVGLTNDYLEKKMSDLSVSDKNKVILASKLQEKIIVLYNFSLGLTKKEIESFKALFKKIVTYNRKIVLFDKNSSMFLNCVEKIYVLDDRENVLFETNDIYSLELTKYIDAPELVQFINDLDKKGIKINKYVEFDELLKAIYRIKS